MLCLTESHRRRLKSKKRGLTDGQIEMLGLKSTPPPYLCRPLTERLVKQGCTVQGVPGFYLDDRGEWTVKFGKHTPGILIPAIGIDGLIKGAQILLDVPIKDRDDPPDKAGTKYIWLSSSNRYMGTTSGSPVHFVGNPSARTVYITEGLLKADIAHCLMDRSFIGIAGANNVAQLGPLFALLAQNGTVLVVEAHDMDKFQNEMIMKGAAKIYPMAREHGLDCRQLTWNPNYKGVDDWQLALREKERQGKEKKRMDFKQQYLHGLCNISDIDVYAGRWHGNTGEQLNPAEYLGLTEPEYQAFLAGGNAALEPMLQTQRKGQRFRIYQLDLADGWDTVPFAFMGIEAMHEAGFQQPPAAKYRLICDGMLYAPCGKPDSYLLEQIFFRYNDRPPGRLHRTERIAIRRAGTIRQ